MPNLHKPAHSDSIGYDEDRNLQVMSVKKRAKFYLVAGANLDVATDDEDIASTTSGADDNAAAHKDRTLTGWENAQVIRNITVTANAPGTTQLRATLGGRDMIAPLTIRVMDDATRRQVGKARNQVTSELRNELQNMSLREAVLRVAEDQMHSAIAQSDGFGVYNMDAGLDWCGGFAYWCWDQASAIKGVNNPFGGDNKVLWSPQRAIDWAMITTTPGQLLRYKGESPMDGMGMQDFHDIGWSGYNLEPGDIVLFRFPNGKWRHVSMIHALTGSSSLETIDGNQGTKGTSNTSISLHQRNIDNKVAGGLTRTCM
jgi:hypothetical protein